MSKIELIKDLLKKEQIRQEREIDLIASENYASNDILDACGHCIQNKYSEGWVPYNLTEDGYEKTSYNRFYEGYENIDEIEKIAIDGVCQAFNTKYANVQPHSGSSANVGVYYAACKYFKCKPSDLHIISHSLNSYSHLTHGSKASISGQWFISEQFEADDNGLFNYEKMKELINNAPNRQTVLVVGFSAYPQEIDYERIANIVRESNKEMIILFDTSHISGLIVAGEHPNPMIYDYGKSISVLTSTTHKTLRMSRHAIITTNNLELAKIIDKSVFPGLQGGALQNMIAGVAIGFQEVLQPSFKEYIKQLKSNIQSMVEVFKERNVNMVSGGSTNHLILLDLRNKGISGRQLEKLLKEVGIVTNKNAIIGDTLPKSETSGLRIGTAAITTRGANNKDCKWIAHKICDIIDILTNQYDYECIDLHKAIYEQNEGRSLTDKEVALLIIKEGVEHWCLEHPIYERS